MFCVSWLRPFTTDGKNCRLHIDTFYDRDCAIDLRIIAKDQASAEALAVALDGADLRFPQHGEPTASGVRERANHVLTNSTYVGKEISIGAKNLQKAIELTG